MSTVGIDVESLFDGTGSLGTNSLFYAMVTNNTSLESYANPRGYLSDIKSISVAFQNSTDTSNFAAIPKTPPPGLIPLPNVDSPTFEIMLQLAKDNKLSGKLLTSILDGLAIHYDDIKDNITLSATGKQIDKFHSDFQKYMGDIVHDITTPFFAAGASNSFAFPTRLNAQTQVGLYYEALLQVGIMSNKKITNVMPALDNAMMESLAYVYENKGASPSGADDDKLIFQDLMQNKLSSAFYYNLRNQMIDRLEIPQDVYPSNTSTTAIFMKKLLVDLYIKTQTPYIQFLYLQTMIKDYQKTGDFVNVRFCLLSQVAYVNCWLKALGAILNGVVTNNNTFTVTSPSDVLNYMNNGSKVSVNTIFNGIYQSLKDYLGKLNTNFTVTGKFSNQIARDDMNSLIKNLQDLSRRVQQDSQTIATQQNEIKSAQITLRNTSQGIQQVKETYTRAVVEFYIYFSFAILLIVIGGVLLLLKKESWVLMGSMVLAIIILLYSLIRMIFSYFF